MNSSLNTAAIFGPVELPLEIARQRVLGEKEAAEFVGLSPMTLERMRKQGVAPQHVRLSARRLGYRICDLTDWLDARVGA